MLIYGSKGYGRKRVHACVLLCCFSECEEERAREIPTHTHTTRPLLLGGFPPSRRRDGKWEIGEDQALQETHASGRVLGDRVFAGRRSQQWGSGLRDGSEKRTRAESEAFYSETARPIRVAPEGWGGGNNHPLGSLQCHTRLRLRF